MPLSDAELAIGELVIEKVCNPSQFLEDISHHISYHTKMNMPWAFQSPWFCWPSRLWQVLDLLALWTKVLHLRLSLPWTQKCTSLLSDWLKSRNGPGIVISHPMLIEIPS